MSKRYERLDTRRVRDSIKLGIESQIRRSVAVECPTDVVRAKGTVFYCDINSPGVKPSKVRVTQTDDEGGFFWEIRN